MKLLHKDKCAKDLSHTHSSLLVSHRRVARFVNNFNRSSRQSLKLTGWSPKTSE